MKKLLLFLVIGTCACRTIPNRNPDKTYTDTATILRKQGYLNCRLLINTDHHGVFDTYTLPNEICDYYHEGDRIRVQIENGWATPLDHIDD